MSISRKIYSIALVGACSLLTACGGAPSESDIKAAFDSKLKSDSEKMDKMLGKGTALNAMGELKVLNKIGCKEDGEKAYKCDIEMEVKRGGVTNKGPLAMRFVKSSDGWTLAN